MKLKKSKCSFVIWILISLAIAVSIAINVIRVFKELGFHNHNTLIGFVCLSFILCFVVFEILSFLFHTINETDFLSEQTRGFIVKMTVILLFLISVFGRLSYVITADFSVIEQEPFYIYALSERFETCAVSERVYVFLLRGFMYLFGTKPHNAVIFQFLLEECIFILFYFLIRKMACEFVSCMILLMTLLLKSYNIGFNGLSVEPIIIIFLFGTLILFLYTISYGREHAARDKSIYALFGVIGILNGFLCTADILGIALILTETVICLTEWEPQKKHPTKAFEQKLLNCLLLCLFVSLVFFLISAVLLIEQGDSVHEKLQYYFQLYFSKPRFSFFAVNYQEKNLLGLMIGVLSSMWFFAFMSLPFDFAKLGCLLTFFVYFLQFMGINRIPYTMLNSTCPLIVCASGIYGIYYYQKYVRPENEKKKITFPEDDVFSADNQPFDLEPEKTKPGDEHWSQVFRDGRTINCNAEVLYRKVVKKSQQNTFLKENGNSTGVTYEKENRKPRVDLESIQPSSYREVIDYDITELPEDDDFDIT